MNADFISTQAYPFMQRAQANGRDWHEALDDALGQAAAAGLQGWEPIVRTPEQVATIGETARGMGSPCPRFISAA